MDAETQLLKKDFQYIKERLQRIESKQDRMYKEWEKVIKNSIISEQETKTLRDNYGDLLAIATNNSEKINKLEDRFLTQDSVLSTLKWVTGFLGLTTAAGAVELLRRFLP